MMKLTTAIAATLLSAGTLTPAAVAGGPSVSVSFSSHGYDRYHTPYHVTYDTPRYGHKGWRGERRYGYDRGFYGKRYRRAYRGVDSCEPPRRYGRPVYNRGYDRGYDEGFERGIRKGLKKGAKKGERRGFDRGYDKGQRHGYDRGYEQGHARGHEHEQERQRDRRADRRGRRGH